MAPRRFARALPLVALVGSLAPLSSGCGALPAAANALGPDHTKRAPATCAAHAGQTRMLVVDWDSVDRADVEARAQKGMVVVRYEGCRLEVLKRCKVKGDRRYGYAGLTPKKDDVSMRDSAEVYANVPLSAAKLDAKLEHAGSLDVNMTIVGQLDADRGATRDELEGECDDATHLVTGITVGAFEFSASNAGSGEAGVSIMGAGAGTKAAERHEVLAKDGDDGECQKATASDTKPPFGCGALLRLEVVPIGAARSAEPTCPSGTAWNGGQCVAVRAELHCPAGQIADRERGCVTKKEDVVHTGGLVAPVASDCADAASCKARCDANDPKGCLGLGGALRAKLGVGKPSPDGDAAEEAFRRACDGGEASACTALGEMMFQGLGIARDPKGSLSRFEKACRGSDFAGCNDMGLALAQSSPADYATAKTYFEKACSKETGLGCLGLGMLYRDGKGVARDASRAKALFKQACSANVVAACKL
jgi:hypothetical protein